MSPARRLCDPREDLTHFRTEIHFQPQNLSAFGTFSATLTWPTRSSTLAKSSIVILPSSAAAAGVASQLPLARPAWASCGSSLLPSGASAAGHCSAVLPSVCILSIASCRRGEIPGSTLPSFVAELQVVPT